MVGESVAAKIFKIGSVVFELWPFNLILVWFGLLRIYVDLAVFQPYLDLEAGDNQSLKIEVAKPGIEPRSSCSASQELNHSATTAPPFNFLTPWSVIVSITKNEHDKTTYFVSMERHDCLIAL